MGWTFTQKPKNVKEYLDTQIYGFETEKRKLVVLESYIVKLREYYALCQSLNKETGEVTYFAGVAVLDYRRNDAYDFGYKDMDETCQPYYYNAPADMIHRLNEIAPVDAESHAGKWRTGCLEVAARKAEKREKLKSVKLEDFKPGQKVKLYDKIYVLRYITEGRLRGHKKPQKVWMVDTGHALTKKQLAEVELVG